MDSRILGPTKFDPLRRENISHTSDTYIFLYLSGEKNTIYPKFKLTKNSKTWKTIFLLLDRSYSF
jgi:hypothetical protein